MFKNTKVFCSFPVDDIPKAKEFYSQVLGLEVTEENMGLLELQIPGSNSIIIYPKPNHEPATFAILNFPVQNIHEAVDALTQKEVNFKKYKGEL